MIAKLLGIVLLLAAVAIFEWPKIEQEQRKEKKVFILLCLVAGCLLAVVVYFPELPGPNKWMLEIFKPFSRML